MEKCQGPTSEWHLSFLQSIWGSTRMLRTMRSKAPIRVWLTSFRTSSLQLTYLQQSLVSYYTVQLFPRRRKFQWLVHSVVLYPLPGRVFSRSVASLNFKPSASNRYIFLLNIFLVISVIFGSRRVVFSSLITSRLVISVVNSFLIYWSVYSFLSL